MLTSSLQEIRSEIMGWLSQDKNISDPVLLYNELLRTLEQMDFLETQLNEAYKEGGLAAAAGVIIKPAQPNCQICGRTIISLIS